MSKDGHKNGKKPLWAREEDHATLKRIADEGGITMGDALHLAITLANDNCKASMLRMEEANARVNNDVTIIEARNERLESRWKSVVDALELDGKHVSDGGEYVNDVLDRIRALKNMAGYVDVHLTDEEAKAGLLVVNGLLVGNKDFDIIVRSKAFHSLAAKLRIVTKLWSEERARLRAVKASSPWKGV